MIVLCMYQSLVSKIIQKCNGKIVSISAILKQPGPPLI